MSINFDLISDLYLENLDNFSWADKATSLFCIVAGNISKDHSVLFEFLETVSQYYEAVFFIDGDLEHEEFDGDFDTSYASIRDHLELMEHVFFMHENIIILPDVTLLATNGWTTFEFTSKNSFDDNLTFLEDRNIMSLELTNKIFKLAVTDQHYMYNSVESCQEMSEVKNVVLVTNSVPTAEFISHDYDYDGTILGDLAGNSGIAACLKNDLKNKISTWIFGKYPGDLDYTINGIRFVSNPAKNKNPDVYYPKIIKF